ncbi:MAG: serpin family protein [Saprospiraceae bacterium]|nr:serpin family protein [Saprospiraceae bacterium]
MDTKTFVILFSIALFTWQCQDSDLTNPGPTTDPDEVVLSCQEEPLVCDLAKANNNFGLELFQKLHEQKPTDNIFISPTSLATALGMTINGAQNQTLDEMKMAMALQDWNLQDMNQAYKQMLPALPLLDNQVDLAIANAIYYEETFPFEPSFLELNTNYFDAEVTGLNFRDEGSVDVINGWVHNKTNGLIPDIIDMIPATAVMYLLNAIYFKSDWRTQFDADKTFATDFHKEDQTTTTVDMMTFGEEASVPYFNHPLFQMVDLAYADSVYSMALILPKEGSNVHEVIEELTEENYSQWVDALFNKNLEVYLPKFTMEDKQKETVKIALRQMGMEVPFEEVKADFTGMGPLGLYISDVIHKSYIEVNEAGTEAAAVTAVEISNESISLPQEIRFDKPFVFVIRENQTGNVLFVGKLMNP